MANVSFMKDGMEIWNVRGVHAQGGFVNVINAATEKVAGKNGLDIGKGGITAGRDWDEARIDGQRVTSQMYNQALLRQTQNEILSQGKPAQSDNTPKVFTAPKTIPNWSIE
ncbi:MAG: hypothetical protein ACK4NR_11460 [Micavibrio sp.]